jgi:hypothetical protein
MLAVGRNTRVGNASRRPFWSHTGPSRETAFLPRTACLPGALPSAACASSSSIIVIGTTIVASIKGSSTRPKKSISPPRRLSKISRSAECSTAGGGIKRGFSYGATDELGYAAVENPVSVHDFHATMLYLMGIDAAALTVKYQGLDVRLTGT